jgi:hypothetical protein
MRHAIAIGLAIIVLLLILGAPFLNIRWGFPDDRVLPGSASARQVGDQVRNDFAIDSSTNVTVVIPDLTGVTSDELGRYAAQLSQVPDVSSVGREIQADRVTVFTRDPVIAAHPRRPIIFATSQLVGRPAAVQATIREGNTIAINARGIKTLRVWLGQAFDAQSGWKQMVDLTKPVVQLESVMVGQGDYKGKLSISWKANDKNLGATPITLSYGPVMPTSVRYAVPFGSTRSSAVCTCVCVPTTAVTVPSRCQPIATFSEVASAWKSTKMIRVRSRSRSISRLTTTKGSSMLSMKTRPITLTTPTERSSRVRAR